MYIVDTRKITGWLWTLHLLQKNSTASHKMHRLSSIKDTYNPNRLYYQYPLS